MFNDEVDAVILGRATAEKLEDFIQDGIKKSKQVDPASWQDRPLGERLKELLYGAWQELL